MTFKRYLSKPELESSGMLWEKKKEQFLRVKQFVRGSSHENKEGRRMVCPERVVSLIEEEEMMRRVRETKLNPVSNREEVSPLK